MERESEKVRRLVPPVFKERVLGFFGQRGEEWLENLPHLLATCIDRWELTSFSPMRDLSLNLIISAISPIYGRVVLKIGVPHQDLYREMEAIPLFREGSICKRYALDRERGALLLEQVLPGRNLTYLHKKRRIEVAVKKIPHFPVPFKRDYVFPTYQELMERTFARARKNKRIEREFLPLLHRGEIMMKAIYHEDRERFLLHGDLHHFNLLEDREGGWKAIDPKGIIGPLSMEVGPFIKNQLLLIEGRENRRRAFHEMIESFCRALERRRESILYACMVYMLLSTCWHYEEVHPLKRELEETVEICHLVNTSL